jgi:SAM-dependent methyltransferase
MNFGQKASHEDDPAYGDPDTFYSHFYDSLPPGDVRGLFRYAHRAMERPYRKDDKFQDVIEVGAGTGNHFGFVRHAFMQYTLTDLREVSVEKAKASFSNDPRVTCSIADALDLPFVNGSFDRLIATCLLIHLPQPERALIEWRRVVRTNGVLTIYVPNEGALTHLTRRFTSTRMVNRSGFHGYDLLQARDHPNRSDALDLLIAHTFRKDRLIRGGWPVHSSPLACRLFTVYHARVLG